MDKEKREEKTGEQVKYLSTLIGDDYKNFHNQLVGFSAGTGTGKSTAILEHIAPYAKEEGKSLLYLCNRSCLEVMIKDEVNRNRLTNVTVLTYQTLESKIRKKLPIKKYDYIVADECHYFMGDSVFNRYTDLSYKYIIPRKKNSIVILMSATAKTLFNLLIEKGILEKRYLYEIPGNYDYVKKLKFYEQDDLKILIDEILSNEQGTKIIVFCNSANRMIEMYEKYKDKANYICSDHAKNAILKKFCDNSCLDKKDGKYSFEKRILFTTTALDNGFSLKDPSIKHIFCEIFDADGMIQCFGRKRSLDKNDTCTFYVSKYSLHKIYSRLRNVKEDLEVATQYKNNRRAFMLEHQEDYRTIIAKNEIFDDNQDLEAGIYYKDINLTRYLKYQLDVKNMEQMQEYGYMEFVKGLFDSELPKRSEEIGKKNLSIKEKNLLKYLSSLKNKPLYEKDKIQITERFKRAGISLRGKGIKTMNNALDKRFKDFPLRFTNKDENNKRLIDKNRRLENGRLNPNTNKAYWILR